jgi:hypothetical protein
MAGPGARNGDVSCLNRSDRSWPRCIVPGGRSSPLFAFVTLMLFWLLPDLFGWAGVALTGWCAYFFRDPVRVTPQRERW